MTKADQQAARWLADCKPAPEYLMAAVSYDAETGLLTWRNRADMPKRWNTIHAGMPAFAAKDSRGYKKGSITINGRRFHISAHQVAWAVCYGTWAVNVIDHIDGCKSNNRISNLRDVTQSQNLQNGRTPQTNKSGLKGVSWSAHANKWQSSIRRNGSSVHLGYYPEKHDAHEAYKAAAKQIFGEFARFQ